MEYELFLLTDLSAYYIKDIIMKYMNEKIYNDILYEEHKDYIFIACKYFQITIELEDIANIPLVSKIYLIELNQCISIHIFGETCKQGLLYIFELINELLIKRITNMFFLEDSGVEIFRKENDNLHLMENLDEEEYALEKKYFDLLVFPKTLISYLPTSP